MWKIQQWRVRMWHKPENDKQFFAGTLLAWHRGNAVQKGFEPHARKYCVCWMRTVRFAVYTLSRLHGNLYLLMRNVTKKNHSLLLPSWRWPPCIRIWRHQLVQFEPWSTGHATSFPVFDVCWSGVHVVAWLLGGSFCRWNCCLWRCRIWRYETNRGSELVSIFNDFLDHVMKFFAMLTENRLVIELEMWCFPWLFKSVVQAFSYRRLSDHATTHGWSSPAMSSKCSQPTSVHPIFICELR